MEYVMLVDVWVRALNN